jgi:hypothetical protein
MRLQMYSIEIFPLGEILEKKYTGHETVIRRAKSIRQIQRLKVRVIGQGNNSTRIENALNKAS